MFDDDMAVFMNEFAEPVLWDGVEIRAIFDAGYQRSGVGELGMDTTVPALTLPTRQVPVDPVGQLVGVRGQKYTVDGHEPDGTGMSVLILVRA